jgi:hypothetical protein
MKKVLYFDLRTVRSARAFAITGVAGSMEEGALLGKGLGVSSELTGDSLVAFEETMVSLYVLELEELDVFNS